METQYKAAVEALQSSLQVLQLKTDTFQVSVDQARSVQASLLSILIVATTGSRIFTFLGAAVSMYQAKLCVQVQTYLEFGIDLAKLPS